MNATEEIKRHLMEVEREHDVRVLLAVESGSRAWGFESANSDWDVRFIYVHKLQWYLSVEKKRDVIDYMYEDGVDLVGWDLKKALSLLRQSNPSLFEWLHSPIVYHADGDFMHRIHEVEDCCFNPAKLMFHYNHIYLKHDIRYLQKKKGSLKVFFYYLRGILACKWIEQHHTLPPVAFVELMEATVEEDELREKIYHLIAIKKSGAGKDTTAIDTDLKEYAYHWAEYYHGRIETSQPEENEVPTKELDRLLYDMVMRRERGLL